MYENKHVDNKKLLINALISLINALIMLIGSTSNVSKRLQYMFCNMY